MLCSSNCLCLATYDFLLIMQPQSHTHRFKNMAISKSTTTPLKSLAHVRGSLWCEQQSSRLPLQIYSHLFPPLRVSGLCLQECVWPILSRKLIWPTDDWLRHHQVKERLTLRTFTLLPSGKLCVCGFKKSGKSWFAHFELSNVGDQFKYPLIGYQFKHQLKAGKG